MLTQEAIDEQMRGFIAPLTRQLEDLTRPVQEMSTKRHPNSYPRTELGAIPGTAMPQSDIIPSGLIMVCSWQDHGMTCHVCPTRD